jgi:hypothetical protein
MLKIRHQPPQRQLLASPRLADYATPLLSGLRDWYIEAIAWRKAVHAAFSRETAPVPPLRDCSSRAPHSGRRDYLPAVIRSAVERHDERVITARIKRLKVVLIAD